MNINLPPLEIISYYPSYYRVGIEVFHWIEDNEMKSKRTGKSQRDPFVVYGSMEGHLESWEYKIPILSLLKEKQRSWYPHPFRMIYKRLGLPSIPYKFLELMK